MIQVTTVAPIQWLVGCVHFKKLSAAISSEDGPALGVLEEYMREFDPYTGYIHGYADELEIPDRTRRSDLAEARARALRDALIDMGVGADRFVIYVQIDPVIGPNDEMDERVRRNAAACLFTTVPHDW